MKNNPPKYAAQFLQWYCNSELYEEISGDLYEAYQSRLRRLGKQKANILFWINVIQFFQPFAIKKRNSTYYSSSNSIDMIYNYLKIAFRNLLKYKLYTFSNILGLSTGVACCLLLSLYIFKETSYDKHFADADRLFRLTSQLISSEGKVNHLPTTSPPTIFGLKDEVPELEAVTRVFNPPGVALNLVTYQDVKLYEPNGYIADSTFFDVFSFEFIEGNPYKSLSEANSVVLSEAFAQKLFGSESALNKSVRISQGWSENDFKVTGIFKSPEPSHLQPSFITSINTDGWGEFVLSIDSWMNQNFILSYFKLRSDAQLAEVERKMNQVLEKYGQKEMEAQKAKKKLLAESIADIHLYTNYSLDILTNSNIVYIYILSAITFFILLIACINFINIATASATRRAAEVGVRKVLGARHNHLVVQFLGESMLIAFISVIIGAFIADLILPFFNQLAHQDIQINSTNLLLVGTLLIGVTLSTGLIAGLYPAFFLSSFKPIQALKNKSVSGNSGSVLRKGLVVFQFTIAILLFSGVLIIHQQLNFVKEKSLGINPKSKIVLPLRTQSAQKAYPTIKSEIEKLAPIQAVSGVDYLVGDRILSDFTIYPEGGGMEDAVLTQLNYIDEGLPELTEMKLLAGRTFNSNRISESQNKVVINRTALNSYNYNLADVIGKKIHTVWRDEVLSFEVIGVVEDFHHNTMHSSIAPQIMMMKDNPYYRYLIVSTNIENTKSLLEEIGKIWKQNISDTPFESIYLDQHIQAKYERDENFAEIIQTFALIALIISCLGLYGLSLFVAQMRLKEIGIRKVLGASLGEIISSISVSFGKLVLFAIIIATPISYFAMSQWLENFAYHIQIHWGIYVFAGGLSIFVALSTTAYQSIKVALVNPVETLKSE